MSKRVLSLILAISCVLAILPGAAFPASAVQNQIHEINIPVQVNPLYADVLDVEDFADQLKALERPAVSGGMSTMAAAEPDYVDMDTATEQVREAMKQRAEMVTVYYYAAESLTVNDTVLAVLANATAHTGVSTEGDYLLWQLGTYAADGMYQPDPTNNRNKIQITYTFTYYTTAAQEVQMDTAVAGLLSELALDGASEYEQVKGIYDYICSNVSYDYDNLYDDAYMLKYSGYAALVNKTAVCQGYAVLFYRLALELGLDARVITGVQTSTGGNHSWNIVRIGDCYYNLDSTWDAGRSEYSYFLLSNESFVDHTRKDMYKTDSFNQVYPMSDADYDPSVSGQCGENAYWSFDEATGTLTISGEGAMNDYQVQDPAPWFDYYESIVRVVIESGITAIGSCAFNSYPVLQTIEIPDTVQTIGRGVFTLCTSLTDIELPEGITIIKDCTFADCTSLTSITLPSTLETIEMLAFSNCTALTSVTIPDSVTEIGRAAFNNCSSLTSVQFGTGLTVISENMFNSCTALTAVEIPANVTEISYEAFAFCTGLTEITFLGDAPSIYDGAFYDVTATAYYPANNTTWTEEIMQQYGGTITWVAYEPEAPAYSDGWNQIEGAWYYYQDGAPVTGWLKSGNYWYYLDSTGAMTTGWVKLGSNWFYMNQNGVMMTGWQKINGHWYYFASGGAMQTGWISVGGKWYYMASGGAMQTSWVSVGGKWYYMDSSGAMQTGWVTVNGSRYYLDSKGVMQTGWIQLDGTWYYLTSSGKMATGWTHDGSYWYYMDENGMMQRGWITVNGKWYYLNKSGVMQTGWLKDGNYWYYLDATGAMVTGTQVINGKTYVFNKSGVWIG